MPAYQIYNVPLFKIEFLGGAVNKNSPLLMNFRFVGRTCECSNQIEMALAIIHHFE